MYGDPQPYPPMNFNDLFAAQNLGMQPIPVPMSGAQSALIPQTQPMSGPQNVPMPPEANHIADVIGQYVQNKQQQQNTSGMVQDILSNRMQPELQDASKSAYLSNQNGPGGYVSPEQAMDQRYAAQLAPYTQGLNLANQNAELSGRLMQNNITQQTGLPMAMAQLQHDQMANDIMAKTGMSKAEAEITLANAQAGQAGAMGNYYNTALQRDIAEKQFDYQHNPQMIQATNLGNLMATAMQPSQGGGLPSVMPSSGGMSMPGSAPNQGLPQAVQPAQAPLIGRGAILDKLGMMTEGQKEQDKNFADSYQTYANQGGAQRTANSLQTIDDVINQLKTGQLTTGGSLDAASMGPNGEETWTGRLLNSPILVARTRIANSILPQAKALFGARVTNFDAQSLINSQGLDPLADTQTNIDKLETLKQNVLAGQRDLQNSGQYFTQNGTLAGYNPPVNQGQPSISNTNIPDGAIQMLRQNPSLASAFEQKYGVSSKGYLQ